MNTGLSCDHSFSSADKICVAFKLQGLAGLGFEKRGFTVELGFYERILVEKSMKSVPSGRSAMSARVNRTSSRRCLI